NQYIAYVVLLALGARDTIYGTYGILGCMHHMIGLTIKIDATFLLPIVSSRYFECAFVLTKVSRGFGVPMGPLSTLMKVIVYPDIFIHLLKKFLTTLEEYSVCAILGGTTH
ncbi:hypothetical protein ACJX0J_007551, partial [Zea mays]